MAKYKEISRMIHALEQMELNQHEREHLLIAKSQPVLGDEEAALISGLQNKLDAVLHDFGAAFVKLCGLFTWE